MPYRRSGDSIQLKILCLLAPDSASRFIPDTGFRAGADRVNQTGQSDWRDVFCGRDSELEALKTAYRTVAAPDDGRPQTVVVLADRGMGKTRLVQEFFAWLSTEVDQPRPDGYWPDRLGRQQDNLRVNPDPGECLADFALPFLWWGVRLDDPDRRNASFSSALSSYREKLTPHLEPMMRSRRFAKRMQEGGAALGDATKAGLGLIPVLGNLLAADDIRKAATRIWQTTREGFDDKPVADLGDLEASQRRDMVEEFLADIAALLDPAVEDMASVPLVLFVDDAQFAAADGSLLEFVTRLQAAAYRAGWPLLLIATHWMADWERDIAAGEETSLARELSRTARAADPDWAPLELGGKPDLADVVRTALPGLTGEQTALVLHRADGNPQLLQEIVSDLLASEGLFEDYAVTGPLSEFGQSHVETAEYDLLALIRKRLQDPDRTPVDMRNALALSSLQGMRFLGGLTAEVAQALKLGETGTGLDIAERPHRIIASAEAGIAEFVQRVYRDAALSALAQIRPLDHAERALDEAARALFDDDAAMNDLSETARETALAFIAGRFETAEDAADQQRAAHAYAALARSEMARGDRHAALKAAERILEPVLAAPETLAWSQLLDVDAALSVYEEWNRFGETRPMRAQIVGGFRGLLKEEDTPETLRELAISLARLGDTDRMLNGPAAARPTYEESAGIFRRHAERTGTPEARRELSLALEKLADVIRDLDGHAAALPLYEESAAISRELAETVGTPGALRDLSVSLSRLGGAALAIDGPAAAKPYFDDGAAIVRQLAETHDDPGYWQGLAIALGRLAGIAWSLESPAAARPFAQEREAIARRLADTLDTPPARRGLVAALNRLGEIVLVTDGPAAARPLIEESARISRELADIFGTPEAWSDLAVTLHELGDLTDRLDAPDAAREIYSESADIARRLADRFDTLDAWRDLSVSLDRLGNVIRDIDGPAGARPVYEESASIRRALAERLDTPAAWHDLAIILNKLAGTILRLDGPEQARPLCEENARITRHVAEALDTAKTWRSVSIALETLGDVVFDIDGPAAARDVYADSVAIARRLAERPGTPVMQRDLSVGLNRLGDAVRDAEGPAAARAHYEESTAIRRRLAEASPTPGARRDVMINLTFLAKCIEPLDGPAAAASLLEEARALAIPLAEQNYADAQAKLEKIDSEIARLAG